MEKLFSEFEPSSASDWKQQIIKDLKGAEFEKLLWQNPNGFKVNPFYTAEDLSETKQPLFSHASWEVCEEIVVENEKTANAKALTALNGGAGSLHFVLTKPIDFNSLLNEISIEHIELCFILKYDNADFEMRFQSYLDKKNISSQKLNGAVCRDAIGEFIRSGNKESFKEAQQGNTWVDASIYQNAGATQVFELACSLAHAHEYLINLKQKKKFRFSVSIGSDFFGEIAKLRALRKLWPLVAKEYQGADEICVHAINSELNQSSLDAYNNMLRSTTEGMSAVIGGCNSLILEGYNKTFENSSAFSERIARNQQLIFKEESYLDKVADMSTGSYYIEHLTDEIASKAWEEFKVIESKGGFMACLESNYIQDKIAKQAAELIEKFGEQKIVLVGVNKFQNKTESGKPRKQHEHLNAVIKPLNLSDHLVKENA